MWSTFINSMECLCCMGITKTDPANRERPTAVPLQKGNRKYHSVKTKAAWRRCASFSRSPWQRTCCWATRKLHALIVSAVYCHDFQLLSAFSSVICHVQSLDDVSRCLCSVFHVHKFHLGCGCNRGWCGLGAEGCKTGKMHGSCKDRPIGNVAFFLKWTKKNYSLYVLCNISYLAKDSNTHRYKSADEPLTLCDG